MTWILPAWLAGALVLAILLDLALRVIERHVDAAMARDETSRLERRLDDDDSDNGRHWQ